MAFDRFWGKSMTELANISHQEMYEFAAQFQELIFSMPFQVPEDLILLGRTVGILSGMCTGLDPDFNLWQGLAPFAQQLIAEEVTADWKVWLEELGKFVRPWLSFPQRLDLLLGRLERGELAVQAPQLSSEVNQIKHSIHRLTGGLVFAVLLLGGIQLYLAGEVTFGVGLIVAAAATLVWVMLSGR
jgi:predicted unusual protein kinase regulating ubiquinone biosynthesis (AarF/ABC1/UbiB family)